MKFPLLIGALTLSLAANVWLVSSRQPSLPLSGSSLEKTALTKSDQQSQPASVVISKNAVTWASLQHGDDLPTLVAGLRAAGFPPDTIRAIAAAQLTELFRPRRKTVFDPSVIPFWKPAAPTPAEQMALRSLNAELQRELRSLGLDPLSREEREIQTRRYGNLSPEKAAALEKISLDYLDLISQLVRNDGQTPKPPSEAQRLLLEKEKRDDLAALLTPTELTEYDLRNSNTAQILRTAIRDIDVSEDEYRALFGHLQTKEREHPSQLGPQTAELLDEQVSAHRELLANIRSTLGDDRFRKYVLSDQSSREIGQFAEANPSITVDHMLILLETQKTLFGALMRATSRPGQTSAESRAAINSVVADFRSKLATQIGVDNLSALLKGNYGLLSSNLNLFQPPPKN